MELLELPAELIHRIFVQCDLSAVRCLRSVNKLSLAIANEYFLPNLKLFFLKEDYDTALELLQDLRIAKSIRTITLDADVFPVKTDVDFRAWNQERKHQIKQAQEHQENPGLLQIRRLLADLEDQEYDTSFPEMRSLRREKRDLENSAQVEKTLPSKNQLQEAYDYFLALSASQKDFMKNKYILKMLPKVFKACSRVSTVIIAPRYQEVPTSHFGEHFRKAMVRPWLEQHHSAAGFLYAAAMGFSFGSLVRHMDIGALSYRVFRTCSKHQALFHGIDALESLKIVVDNDELYGPREIQDRDIPNEASAGYLVGFLTQAPRLRQLSVDRRRGLWLPLRGIVGSYTWEHLASLCLIGFTCTADGLAGFLGRHRGTLSGFSLHSPYVEEISGWETCFRSIAGTFAKLERVRLRGAFGTLSYGVEILEDSALFFCSDDQAEDDFTAKVQKYILEGGDYMPDSYLELKPLMEYHPDNLRAALED